MLIEKTISAITPSPPETAAVKDSISSILSKESEQFLSPKAGEKICEATKDKSGWIIAKKRGKEVLANASDAMVSFNSFISSLNNKNVFIVPIGELESFCPAVNKKSSKWIAEVFESEYLKNQAFKAAKDFVKQVLSY